MRKFVQYILHNLFCLVTLRGFHISSSSLSVLSMFHKCIFKPGFRILKWNCDDFFQYIVTVNRLQRSFS